MCVFQISQRILKEILYFQEKNSYVLTVGHLNHFFYFENHLVEGFLQTSFLGHWKWFAGYRVVTPDYCGSGDFPGGKTFHFKIGLYHFVFVHDTFGSVMHGGCTKINPQRFSRPYEFESDCLEFSPGTLLVYGQGSLSNHSDVQTYFYYAILTDPKQISKFKTLPEDFAGFCWLRNKKTGFVPADQLENFE